MSKAHDKSHPRRKTILFACSGASQAGESADRIARKLAKESAGKMGSIAKIAAGDAHAIAEAKAADQAVVIDGCDKDCARIILALAGVTAVVHIRVTELDKINLPGHAAAQEESLVVKVRSVLDAHTAADG